VGVDKIEPLEKLRVVSSCDTASEGS